MTDTKRRAVAKYIGLGAVSVPLSAVTALLPSTLLAAPLVDASSDQAKALQYMDVSDKEKASCQSCVLYQGDEQAESGPCPLFQKMEVKATGWCTAFTPKA